MKKTLLLLSFFTFNLLSAQNWCPPGARWHYRDFNPDHEQYKDGTLQLAYTTTANISYTTASGSASVTCKIIKGTFYGAVSYIYLGVDTVPDYVTYRTYENNNVVYLFNVNTQRFDTIANFNAHIGDSWSYALAFQSCNDFNIPINKVTVYDTGHVVINNVHLKKLVISPPSNTVQNVLIERIGGMPGYLFMRQDCNQDGETYGTFSCYEDNTFPLYKQTGVTNCVVNTVGISANTLESMNINVFPNPSNGNFKIESEQPLTIELYNGLGAMVYQDASKSSGNFDIHVPDLASGLYYLKAISDHGTGYSKLIKQ